MTNNRQRRIKKPLTVRAPIYARDRNIRIVSRPNELWRAERKTAERGTPSRDHWEPLCRDTSKEIALTYLPNPAVLI
jgi:hypothetical protein